jgi:prepilin-type N-terminal cleavage/methylation domain-containing protein
MKARSGFSILEVLAAMTVLALISLLLVSLIDSVGSTTRVSMRRSDAAEQARVALDRIRADLQGMLVREDVRVTFTNQTDPYRNPGDFLRFLSFVSAPSETGRQGENRRLSVVAYRLGFDDPADATSRPALLRGARPVYREGGDSSGFVGNRWDATTARLGAPPELWAVDGAGTSAFPNGDYDVLAEGVVLARVCFLLGEDYRLPDAPASQTTFDAHAGDLLATPPLRRIADGQGGTVDIVDLRKVVGLVVGLVVVDIKVRNRHTRAELLALSDALEAQLTPLVPGTANRCNDPLREWTLLRSQTYPSGVPLALAQAVRGYQEFFPLP